jgi:hypothetical protein
MWEAGAGRERSLRATARTIGFAVTFAAGNCGFVECPVYLAKPNLFLTKNLSRLTLGKSLTTNVFSAKESLP